MLSLYGKTNPPNHALSFCDPPLTPPLSPTLMPGISGSPTSLPLHVAAMSVLCLARPVTCEL